MAPITSEQFRVAKDFILGLAYPEQLRHPSLGMKNHQTMEAHCYSCSLALEVYLRGNKEEATALAEALGRVAHTLIGPVGGSSVN